MKKGTFIVISGPSGVGKGTVCNKLIKELNAWYSISMTTREKRVDEIEGVNYFFVTKEEFEKKINDNDLLEYTIYNNNYYGTPKSKIEERLSSGVDVISETEVEGARNIKIVYPNSLLIYILPPNMKELKNRLEKRGTNTKEDIEKRLSIAKDELKQIKIYDYTVINDDIDKTVEEIKKIITSYKSKY